MKLVGNETTFYYIQLENKNLVFYLPQIIVDKCRKISHI